MEPADEAAYLVTRHCTDLESFHGLSTVTQTSCLVANEQVRHGESVLWRLEA